MASLLLVCLTLLQLSAGFNIDAAAIRAAEESQNHTPRFGSITVQGGMQQTNVTFPDGLVLSLYSARDRNVSIEKNDKPSAPGEFVTPLDPTAVSLGSGPWVAINNYSWSVGSAEEGVVSTIAASYELAALEAAGVSRDNTFLAMFDSTRAGWVIDVFRSSVNSSARNQTQIVGLPNLNGEYMLVGRKTIESQSKFIHMGSSTGESDFNVLAPTAGSYGETDPSKAPLQIGTWMDGLQLAVRSCKALRINVNFINASDAKIQSGFKAVSSYGYSINSTDSASKIQVVARLPFHQAQLDAQAVKNSDLRIAHFDPALGEFRVDDSDSDSTSASVPKILPRAIEGSMAGSVDVQWLLVAPGVSESASIALNWTSTLASATSFISLAAETSTALAPQISSPSESSLSPVSPLPSKSTPNSTVTTTSMRPVVTPITEAEAEKVMQQARELKSRSRSRVRRVRVAKSRGL